MNTCLNVTGLGLVLELSNLHGELPRVGAGHGGGLARGEHAHGPDVHGGLAVLAAQEDAALVQVRGHRAVVRREVVCQAAVHTLAQGPGHHQHHEGMRLRMKLLQLPDVIVSFPKESLSKHGDDEDVDDEADEERDGGLYEVIHVGLPHLPPVVCVDLARLDQGAGEVRV